MSDFDRFNPLKWQEAGLVCGAPTLRVVPGRPSRGAKWAIALSLATAVTCTELGPIRGVTAATAPIARPTRAAMQFADRDPDRVPDGYWSNLMRTVEQLPILEEKDDGPNLEPII